MDPGWPGPGTPCPLRSPGIVQTTLEFIAIWKIIQRGTAKIRKYCRAVQSSNRT